MQQENYTMPEENETPANVGGKPQPTPEELAEHKRKRGEFVTGGPEGTDGFGGGPEGGGDTPAAPSAPADE